MHLIFPANFLLQCLKGQQIVAEDKAVVEDIVVCDAMRSVVGLFGIFKKDARLQPWPVPLPNPSQFKFLLLFTH